MSFSKSCKEKENNFKKEITACSENGFQNYQINEHFSMLRIMIKAIIILKFQVQLYVKFCSIGKTHACTFFFILLLFIVFWVQPPNTQLN